jgi:hypothetical protein
MFDAASAPFLPSVLVFSDIFYYIHWPLRESTWAEETRMGRRVNLARIRIVCHSLNHSTMHGETRS